MSLKQNNKLLNRKKLYLKIFSLISGLFIWMYVVSSAQIELTKIVDLKVDLPKGKSVRNIIPSEVRYRIKGPGIFVRKFVNDKFDLKISKKEYYKKGQTSFILDLEKIKAKLPFGVELVSIEPRNFPLKLERSLRKKVEISPDFSPGILEQFNIQRLSIKPEKIEISGPRSIVKNVQKVKTEEIDSLSVGQNQKVEIKLISPDKRLFLEQSSIIASMELITKNKQRLFKNIPIIYQSMGPIKYVSTRSVDITLVGKEEVLGKLDPESIQVIALIPKGKKGELSIELITELPQGIRLKELTPKSIKVEVE